MWDLINRSTGKIIDKSSIIKYIKNGEIYHNTANRISNEFANYFASIGNKFSENIRKPHTTIESYNAAIPFNNSSLFLKPTCEQEIIQLISELPNKKSSGHDKVDNTLLKELKYELAIPLTFLFNRSLLEGIFPEIIKLAEVIPLHKSNEWYLTTNYRPISLLLTISKLLEKLMYARLYNFMNDTNQIFKSQYGFWSKHSCENAIQELIGAVVKGYENKKHTISVFLDLSKAFDTIPHNILFMKMHRYGIRRSTLDWFRSYLSNQSMRVRCTAGLDSQHSVSNSHIVNIGTPQGSCLGPLIFLIYNNDLFRHLLFCNCILFADDTTIYYSHKDLRSSKWCIMQDLLVLSDWFRANKLTLNTSKSAYILF